jgi:hypothetical protein
MICQNDKCNKEFFKKQKYCSLSCAAIVNNRLYKKRNITSVWAEHFSERSCCYCNISFVPTSYTVSGKFCSLRCNKDHQKYVVTKEKFINGMIRDPDILKRCLSEAQGYTCIECKLSDEWNEKPLRLQLDHIDGNPDNNFPENLRLLCPNCHSQTETFSKGHGGISKRNEIRKKYRSELKRIGAEEGTRTLDNLPWQGSAVAAVPLPH